MTDVEMALYIDTVRKPSWSSNMYTFEHKADGRYSSLSKHEGGFLRTHWVLISIKKSILEALEALMS
jgi:hypothetical protein